MQENVLTRQTAVARHKLIGFADIELQAIVIAL